MSVESWIAVISAIITILSGFVFTFWQVRTARSIANPEKYPPLSESKVFKALRKYGYLFYLIIVLIWNLINLKNEVNSPEPLTRQSVFWLIILSAITMFLFIATLTKATDAFFDWKFSNKEKSGERR